MLHGVNVKKIEKFGANDAANLSPRSIMPPSFYRLKIMVFYALKIFIHRL